MIQTKGQASPEFMAVYTVLFTVALILFLIYFDSSLSLFQTQDKAVATRNSQAIAAAINYIYLAGDGAGYELRLNHNPKYENISIGDYSVASMLPHSYAASPVLRAGVELGKLGNGTVAIISNGGLIHVGD